MNIREYYKFEISDYDLEGMNRKDGSFFLETFHEMENDFHKKHPLFFPNYLYSNSRTMFLFDCCLDFTDSAHCGVDLIDGKVDLDTNLLIEKYSKSETVFAMGSKLEGNEEEPIFLIIDDCMMDGSLILEYTPDEEDDMESDTIPVNGIRVEA